MVTTRMLPGIIRCSLRGKIEVESYGVRINKADSKRRHNLSQAQR